MSSPEDRPARKRLGGVLQRIGRVGGRSGVPPTVPMGGAPQFHCRGCKAPLPRRDKQCPACGAAVR